MANNTIRIRTTPNGSDKYLKVKLEQDFDFIEILSLKIGQEDAYRNFCSDYGVVAGRVVINSGFGVPNARVSIFIPIDDVDSDDPNIKGLYPYQVTSDKDSDGVRYNLLPKTSETDNDCFTPVGTFPTKREILDNTDMLDIYCKYYKFTTTTNHAGDFMIFGVPLGTYVVHVDADISDIGIASQRPYDSISQGTPKKFFDSPTKYLGGTNLDKLIQVKSANAGVNVQPFWGNTDTCEIGISRIDIDLNYTIRPCAIFMGNMFGDQDKDSVNKRCTPRRDMGNLCNQVSNEGTIEMIRETIDGTIEKFDIEGGRVMDENGSWAYQIPMNLDYMVTDENGDLALSDDPNKGLPTRASVRFRIGMDQTGGEGRLRTRAKYLVPHNPTTGVPAEIDYEFSEKTKKTSFRSLYWNKIYSVSNFISRYQQVGPRGAHTRNITGIKDVDSCVGDKTPFPYNRVNTSFSPIFFIICLIIKIIGFLIYIFNALIIPILNIVLGIIKFILERIICPIMNVIIGIIRGIRSFLGMSRRPSKIDCSNLINYIPCMYVKCPADEGDLFAPGCKNGGMDSGHGWQRLADTQGPPTYYDGDSFGHGGFADLCGLDDCVAFEMASSMNLFQFDFYNDWVNGALYSFLLKYKKKRKKIEKFCEYDCDDFGIAQGGVDGNGDGNPDNACRTNFLLDVCYKGGGSDQQFDRRDSGGIREGLIKKYNNEFYYAASTHDARAKMFATDIVNLGSVFNCDWQGVPKLQQYLITTTYKMPPHVQEVKDDYSTVLVTGQCDLDGNTVGVFFSINCLGLHVNSRQCLNLRHICEYGVELDEDRQTNNPATSGPAIDGIIGLADLDLDDGDRPKWLRDVFLGLNSTTNSWNLTLPYTSNFNLANAGVYDFVSPTANGPDYVRFRGYYPNTDSSWAQPKHSYYFYFGILPGKTGLDKMNQLFFTTCQPKIVTEFNIITTTTTPPFGATNGGSVTFTFASGTGPFTYVISGPSGYNNTGSVGSGGSTPTGTVGSLSVGTYTITGTDANGNVVTQTFNISSAPALYATPYVSSNCTTAALPNGSITIAAVGGGFTGSTGQYHYTLYNSSCAVVSGPVTFTSVPLVINNLAVDVSPNLCYTPNGSGYTMVVTDAGTGSLVIPNLIVNGATAINVTSTKTDVLCYGGNTGGMTLAVTGGQPPYQINTTTTNGFAQNGLNISGLTADTYVTNVTDSLGTIGQATTIINLLNPFMEIQKASAAVLKVQCDPTQYKIPIYVTSPWTVGGTVYLDYRLDEAEDAAGNAVFAAFPTTFTYTNATTPLLISIPSSSMLTSVTFRMTNAARTCFSEELDIDRAEVALPPSILTANVTGVVNTKQCVPGQVKFKFNISHLTAGFTGRAPYIVTYTVKGINGAFNLTSSLQTTMVTTNQQEITASVPYPSGLVPTSCQITINVKDNVNCVAPTLILPIIPLPSTALSASWSNTTYYNAAASQNWIHKRLIANFGIGTKTGSPYAVYNGTPATEFNYPVGSTLSSTVTDTVGCTIIANG